MPLRPDELEYFINNPEQLISLGDQQARQVLDQYKQSIEETNRNLVSGVEKISQSYDKLAKAMSQALDTDTTLGDYFSKAGKTLAGAFSAAMDTALNRSLPNTLRNLEPGFGKIGENIGGLIFGGLALAITKNPEVAAVATQFGKVAAREYQMQLEGYRMIGATVAPQAYGGGAQPNMDFRRIGGEYRTAIMEIGRDTGATAEQVAKLLDAQSKVGVGFLNGGVEAAKFALAAERVMNLNQGMISSLQTELVSKYGESMDSAKEMVDDMRSAQRELISVYAQSENEGHKAMAAGQILTDTLTQIRNAASQSGGAIEDLNKAAIMLTLTMATGGQGGGLMARPGQMATIGGQLLRGLMPTMTGSMTEEVQRSGLDRILLEQTGMGKEFMGKYLPRAAAGGPEGAMMMNVEQQKLLANAKEGDDIATRLAIVKTSSLYEMGKDNKNRAYAYADRRGIGPYAVDVATEMVQRWMKMGFDPTKMDENNFKIAKDAMVEQQKDPKNQRLLDEFGYNKGTTEIAKQQGEAMLSTMDKVANLLTQISKDIQETWGVKDKQMVQHLKDLNLPEDNPVARGEAPPASSYPQSQAPAGLATNPAGRGPEGGTDNPLSNRPSNNVEQDTMNISHSAFEAMHMNHIRNSGVKQTSGE